MNMVGDGQHVCGTVQEVMWTAVAPSFLPLGLCQWQDWWRVSLRKCYHAVHYWCQFCLFLFFSFICYYCFFLLFVLVLIFIYRVLGRYGNHHSIGVSQSGRQYHHSDRWVRKFSFFSFLTLDYSCTYVSCGGYIGLVSHRDLLLFIFVFINGRVGLSHFLSLDSRMTFHHLQAFGNKPGFWELLCLISLI